MDEGTRFQVLSPVVRGRKGEYQDLIDELRDEYQMGVILITHDLGVVAGHTDRVAVMYLGKIVEIGDIDEIFEAPAHPYTQLC